MTNCLFCAQPIMHTWSLAFLLSFRAIEKPLVCADCRALFCPIDPTTACPGCSRPQAEPKLCLDCQRWQREYPDLPLAHQALFAYNDIAKDYLKQFKIQGDVLLAAVFKKEIQSLLADYRLTHHFVPIPLSATSLAERGFNQVELLLKAAGFTYHSYLTHQGSAQKQSRKNRQERLASPQFLTWAAAEDLKDQPPKILLVDDIYTTGRTLLHAKNLLQERWGHSAHSLEIKSFSLFR